MGERQFEPGFRLSAFDVVILLAGAAATAYFFAIDAWFGAAVAFVVAHFFLFCNVFRISRISELIWAGIFTSLAAGAISHQSPTWPIVFLVSTLATVILIALETRRPSYHGVGWRSLNPQLPEWWKSHVAGDRG
ncbi:MAG TPA: hypothetical protein VGE52_11555 [Pirellulales bacterium]